ncbi:MAG: hypothetical protein HFI19_05125 [Lachnospiraceae bacterium]|jgi:hypothetical protein|uniref:hypothetical protein n=1 Tax=Candidatus Merdisoma sp. JLR.KK006 TaxID=3112626 RepID=UPI002FF33321|nr:hypothetical protein [Lachnospiraceae bacterium]
MRTEHEKIRDLDNYTEQLIRQAEAEGLIKAPVHMKQEIMERSRRMDYQMAVTTRKVSKQMQLFFYSLKVGAAVVTALFLLFMVPKELPKEMPAAPSETARQQEETLNRRLNNGMREINQMLNDMMGLQKSDQMED